MAKNHTYDVIVVGAGIAGLSAAYHLSLAGITNILCLDDRQTVKASAIAPGILFGSSLDNFTRFSYTHGKECAQDYWLFLADAFNFIKNFAYSHDIALRILPRVRLITSQHELIEAEKACQEIQASGFFAELLAHNEKKKLGIGKSILAVQNEGLTAGLLAIDALLLKLKALVSPSCFLGQAVKSVRFENNKVMLETCQQHWTSEFVVFSCHLAIKRLFPEFFSTMVSYVDQYHDVEHEKIPEEYVFTAHHGLEWGGVFAKNSILGGARFLRHLAGFEAEKASPNEKVRRYLQNFYDANCGWKKPVHGDCVSFVELTACDDLPFVGPHAQHERVLFSTGFNGNGLSLGFYAGKILADLIVQGRTTPALRRFFPDRFRLL